MSLPVRLHRFSQRPDAGDCCVPDLLLFYGLLRHEKLIQTFFHDGSVASATQFLDWARSPGRWVYLASTSHGLIGMGVVDGFSGSGNTAYAHLVSLRDGRCALPDAFWQRDYPAICGHPLPDAPGRTLFGLAGCLWFSLLAARLTTLLAVLPGCYRPARRFAQAFGFEPVTVLPGALAVRRPGQVRISDAHVFQKTLNPAWQADARHPE